MPESIPPGHSTCAHRLFGFCAACPTGADGVVGPQGWMREALAWREWAVRRGVLAWPATGLPVVPVESDEGVTVTVHDEPPEVVARRVLER